MRLSLVLLAIFSTALLLPQGLADNILEGRIILGEDGTAILDAYIVRDDINVSFAALNSMRETEIKPEQHIYVESEGTLLRRSGDYWVFQLHLENWFDNYELILDFPQGVKFKEISSNMNYERYESSLHFRGQLVEAPKIDVIYSIEPQKQEQSALLFGYAAGILAVFAAASIICILKFRKKKNLNEGILQTLNPKERELIKLLFENGGKLTQTRLRQKTGLPKSTLSNILRDLESRKLVARYEHGSTFDVELDKRVYA